MFCSDKFVNLNYFIRVFCPNYNWALGLIDTIEIKEVLNLIVNEFANVCKINLAHSVGWS